MTRLIVDTDLGVDDGVAIAWILSQRARPVELAGVSTTWGNTTATRAAASTRALLSAAGRTEVPVVRGAEGPQGGTRSRVGALAHGQDGLWGQTGAGLHGDAGVSRDEPRGVLAFYRELATPGSVLLALGPLSNLALVAREDLSVLRRFERIVVLGGARHGGTMTPVSETNFWHDPVAAETVLSAGLPITLVTRDAHRACELTPADLERVGRCRAPALRFLATPMARYAEVNRTFGEPVGFPDLVAAVVALVPEVATMARPALVRVMAGRDGLTRGQSIMGLTANERLTMIEGGAALQALIEAAVDDPALDMGRALSAVLSREPDNATVVLEVDAARVRSLFLEALELPGGGR